MRVVVWSLEPDVPVVPTDELLPLFIYVHLALGTQIDQIHVTNVHLDGQLRRALLELCVFRDEPSIREVNAYALVVGGLDIVADRYLPPHRATDHHARLRLAFGPKRLLRRAVLELLPQDLQGATHLLEALLAARKPVGMTVQAEASVALKQLAHGRRDLDEAHDAESSGDGGHSRALR